MAADADKILADALKLPAEQRAEVVSHLLRSLDDEENDPLDDDDRDELHAAITRADEEIRGGQTVPASVVLDRLNKR